MIGISLIFLFLGLMAIVTQIFMEDLMELAGLTIIGLPPPSVYAVLVDFWGDLIFMGGIIAIFYGTTAFSSDLGVDKKIFFTLNRPISRSTHYLGKSFIKLLILLIIQIITSIVIYLLATSFYDGYNLGAFLLASVLVSLPLNVLLSFILMLNSRVSTSATAIGGVLFLFLQLFMGIFIDLFDWLIWFAPLHLSNNWHELLLDGEYSNSLTRILALILWMIVPIIIGNSLYNKRDL
jgi:ABC-type transport system involved in multi-copper enzyme maturation permease subunit